MSQVRVVKKQSHWYLKCPLGMDSFLRDWLLIPQWSHSGNGWTFNGDFERPTFTPSVKQTYIGAGGTEVVNHCIVTDGRIYFCDDCTHELAGQTLDLEPFTEAELAELAGDNWA